MPKNNEPNNEDIVNQHTKKFQKELNSGTAALVLLSILNQAKTPLYGYEIAKKLQQNNEGKQGAIYPVLRNLHARELINCDVQSSENGPPRKYYTISTLGEKVLEQWLKSWLATQSQVNNIISGRLNNE